jgi:hypothetical protein
VRRFHATTQGSKDQPLAAGNGPGFASIGSGNRITGRLVAAFPVRPGRGVSPQGSGGVWCYEKITSSRRGRGRVLPGLAQLPEVKEPVRTPGSFRTDSFHIGIEVAGLKQAHCTVLRYLPTSSARALASGGVGGGLRQVSSGTF